MTKERENTKHIQRLPKEGDDISWYGEITVHMIREMIHEEVKDVLYISETVHMLNKKDIGRCYWTDFRLLTNREAKKLCKNNKHLHIDDSDLHHQFFVYNEKRGELVPFRKNEYLMNEKEYMTFDGTRYIYYDNDGNVKQYMTMKGNICSYYDNNNELISQDILLEQEEEEDTETLLRNEKKYKDKKKL